MLVVSCAAVDRSVTDFLTAVEIPGVLLCLQSLLLLLSVLLLTFPSAIVAANVSGVPGVAGINTFLATLLSAVAGCTCYCSCCFTEKTKILG